MFLKISMLIKIDKYGEMISGGMNRMFTGFTVSMTGIRALNKENIHIECLRYKN